MRSNVSFSQANGLLVDDLTLFPVGACGHVTPSGYVLCSHSANFGVLIDCGAQGDVSIARRLRRVAPRISDVVLTHAHQDHIGGLPQLVRDGYRGPIICTQATRLLMEASLADGLNFEPEWTAEDLATLKSLPHTVLDDDDHWREQSIPLAGGFLEASFLPTGHLPGAVQVRIRWMTSKGPRSIVFSGDLGRNQVRHTSALHGWCERWSETADYAVVESTYGGTPRTSPEDLSPEARRTNLARILASASGAVVMCTFALGRMQEVLLDLYAIAAQSPETLRGRVVLASHGLGSKANAIYRDVGLLMRGDPGIPAALARELRIGLHDVPGALQTIFGDGRGVIPRLHGMSSHRQLTRALGRGVIALHTGGMGCGPVEESLARVIGDPQAMVLFTGHCEPDTVGGKLMARREVRFGERIVPADQQRATVLKVPGYSAHADQEGLVHFCAPQGGPPIARKVFVTHGEDPARRALAEALDARGLRASCPDTCSKLRLR